MMARPAQRALQDAIALSWPLARLGEAVEELARRSGLAPAGDDARVVPADIATGDTTDLDRWIGWAGSRLGIEAEAVDTPMSNLARVARDAGPALFSVRDDAGDTRILPVLRSRGRRLHVLGPDLRMHPCGIDALRAAMCARHEARASIEIARLLEAARVPAARHERVRSAMLAERLAAQPIGGIWILRMPPTAGFLRQLAHARLPRRLGWMMALFTGVYALEILGWGLIGNAALDGRLDMGWMTAWLLLVLSLVPLRLMGDWLDSTLALDAGRILRQRLLAGALRTDLDTVRHLGAGQVLGRVMESQALESLALNGGLAVLIAGIELAFAAWIIALGAGGWFALSLLGAWLLFAVLATLRFLPKLDAWTTRRLDMTQTLVERMVGHRTRLAQEPPQRRAATEDRELKDYLADARAMDSASIPVGAVVPAGWMIIGLIGLVPAFVAGDAGSGALAAGLGGVLLAGRALGGISGGIAALGRAWTAWRQVAPLFRAGAAAGARAPFMPSSRLRTDAAGSDGTAPADGRSGPLVDASHLSFRYHSDGEPVLHDLDLTIRQGERILLEGASGGGKSTLGSLLSGLREPASGLLLLNGLDRHTLGEGWHELATEAPQFHENHVLGGTLGFNLLMGRNWPATEEELRLARELCEALGLGDLLDRMPSGLMQGVGETGWQLSHGERSRIFLARALLQDAQLTVLDESFAALDPETLERCLACVFARARTLVVVAHP